jgi:hypothetical protein
MTRLEKLNLTTSQRQDSINYEIGNVIELNSRAAVGFKSGDQWKKDLVAIACRQVQCV